MGREVQINLSGFCDAKKEALREVSKEVDYISSILGDFSLGFDLSKYPEKASEIDVISINVEILNQQILIALNFKFDNVLFALIDEIFRKCQQILKTLDSVGLPRK